MSLIAMPHIGEIVKTDDIISIKVFGSLIYELKRIQLPSTSDEWPFILVETNLKLSFVAKMKDNDKEGNEIHIKKKFMDDYFNLGYEDMAIFNSPWFEEEKTFIENNKDKNFKNKNKRKSVQRRYSKLIRIIKSAEKYSKYLAKKQENVNKFIENEDGGYDKDNGLESKFFSKNQIKDESDEELSTILYNEIEKFGQDKINGIKKLEINNEKKEEVPVDELLNWANHNMEKETRELLIEHIEQKVNEFVLNK